MFSNYNVSTFTCGEKQLRNPMVRVVNCVVEALNKYNVLPRFIIVLLDWDLVRFINYSDKGISKMLGMCVEWLVAELQNAVSIKKEDMRSKRPGSVVSLEPKFIWVKMIDRPGKHLAKYMENREKFNGVLEETLFKTKQMYIMDIDRKSLDRSSFDIGGSLSTRGKGNFWGQFDRTLKKFDKQEITLRPMPVCSNPGVKDNPTETRKSEK